MHILSRLLDYISPATIFKHYRELTTEEQATEWFAILPGE